MIKLVSEKLVTYTIVRPAHGLGTCGWSPKAWQIGIISPGQTKAAAFLESNPNWKIEEIENEYK